MGKTWQEGKEIEMQKNVILFTLYGLFNYGNRLQNYAAAELIKDKNMNCTTLIVGQKSKWSEIKYWIRYIRRYVPDSMAVMRKRGFNFERFHRKYINDTWCMQDKLGELEKEYDTFVVGSDQVWNPDFSDWDEAGTYFFDFVQKGKKIALSASIGVEELEEKHAEKMKNWLKDFSYISVRENEAKAIVEKHTDKTAEVLIDPTMALSAEKWRTIKMTNRTAKKICKKENYILTYFLGEKTNEMLEKINRIAQENQLKVVHLNDKDYGKFYAFGPAEFVHLIDNAKLVCTDSFHGAAFSINLKTPFIVFDRKDSSKDMSSRLKTLLSKFNLEQRKWENISKEDYFSPYNNEVDTILEKERKKMDDFLSSALK